MFLERLRPFYLGEGGGGLTQFVDQRGAYIDMVVRLLHKFTLLDVPSPFPRHCPAHFRLFFIISYRFLSRYTKALEVI